MKCLFCSSEANPFISTGGLGDVSGSLPKYLNKKNIDCRIILPLYSDISYEFKKNFKYLKNFNVPVSWRNQYCGVFEYEYEKTKYYFLDNEYYFKRNGIYGHFDDAERFAFFSRAILEFIKQIDFFPDIIHCNDWQTSLVPVYLSLYYCNEPKYKNIKTLFTIHNIQYQGKYSKDIIKDVVGIPQETLSLLEYDGCINFMKGGIETAHFVSTVSKTYSEEIMDLFYSYKLDGILKSRKWKVTGILNGIDIKIYNPSTDRLIYKNYSIKNINFKKQNKIVLQRRLNLKENKEIPMLTMVTRLTYHKGIDLVMKVLEEIINENNIQFVILGSGDKKYEDFFKNIQFKYPGKVNASFGFIPELSHKIYAASDIFLMPSLYEPCGLSQMIAMKYGSIPIVRETGGLKDTVKDSLDGKGTGFTFKNYDSYDMKKAITRALEGYKNQQGWQTLMTRAMNQDNSFNKSAQEYINLYNKLISFT